MKLKFIEKIKWWFVLRKYGMKRLDAESPFLTINKLQKIIRSNLSWRERKAPIFVLEKCDEGAADIFCITKSPVAKDVQEKIIDMIYDKKAACFKFTISFVQNGICLQPEDQQLVRNIYLRTPDEI